MRGLGGIFGVAGSLVFDDVAQRGRDFPVLHLSGHLTPDAGRAEGCIHTVVTHAALDVVPLAHGDPHGHGDGRDGTKDVQQGETETFSIRLGEFTGKAGTTPERKAARLHVVTAVTDP